MTINRTHNQEELAEFYGHAATNTDYNLADAKDIIAFAKRHLGKPYRYGGKGPKNFDCSGFTGFVFNEFGIRLPVSAGRQALAGEPVEKPKPGDIVFFANDIESNLIDHVGIVTRHDKSGIEFIHSRTSRGIVIDRLSESQYFRLRYKGARSVLK